MAERTLLELDRKAILERWPIPEEERQRILAEQIEIAKNGKSQRLRVQAARVIAAFDQLNILDKKVGSASEPHRHYHVHTTEPNPKVIDAQAQLVAVLAESSKQPVQATKPSEMVGEPAVEGI